MSLFESSASLTDTTESGGSHGSHGLISSSSSAHPSSSSPHPPFFLGAGGPHATCTLPFNEAYTPSQEGPQAQINVDKAGPILPADLQVQLALTGYAGTQRRGASSIEIPEAYPNNPHINDFGPLIKGARNPFDGPPSMTRAAKYMFSEDTSTVVQPKYASRIVKPDIRDFAGEMPVGIIVGPDEELAQAQAAAGGAPTGARCVCIPPTSVAWSSVQAFAVSDFNAEDLYKTLVKHGLISGMKNLIVWAPRIKPCLCSYVGRNFAGAYLDFSTRMAMRPACQEIDLKQTLHNENDAFAKDVLAKMYSVQQKRQIWNYAKAAGRLRGLSVRSAYDRDAPLLKKEIHCLGASDLPQVFGPGFAQNPATYNAAYTLSRPSTIFNEDLKKVTGIDYTQHHKWAGKEIPMR